MKRLTTSPVPLLERDTAAHRLWATVACLSRLLRPNDWVLIGGQMVALHLHLAGLLPARSTVDVDLMANVMSSRGALTACRAAAKQLHLEPRPSMDGERLHRFSDGDVVLDVTVPDGIPSKFAASLRRRLAVETPGGRRAAERAALCPVMTTEGEADVPMPDLQGAIVLKARAFVADSRDPGRHLLDIAQLCAAISDPIALAEALDGNERRYLRRTAMPQSSRDRPWVQLDDGIRDDAMVAWTILTR